MKELLTTIYMFFTIFSQSQTWSSKLENAMFQNRINNVNVYTSEVKKIQGELFTISDFNFISEKCLTKEGIFKLDISEDRSTIIVYFLEWIDQVTINWVFTEANYELNNKLRIHQKMDYSFL